MGLFLNLEEKNRMNNAPENPSTISGRSCDYVLVFRAFVCSPVYKESSWVGARV